MSFASISSFFCGVALAKDVELNSAQVSIAIGREFRARMAYLLLLCAASEGGADAWWAASEGPLPPAACYGAPCVACTTVLLAAANWSSPIAGHDRACPRGTIGTSRL